jgi:hypothetical protein
MSLYDDDFAQAGRQDESLSEEADGPDSSSGAGGAPSQLDPDSVLDSLIPTAIDWRQTVRQYPLVSVAALGLAGFFLGRAHGGAIVRGLAAATSAAVMKQLSEVFEGDFFEFE